MRGAFVVQLRSETGAGELQGSVEEVDTGRQARFCSDGELILFLRERFAAARKPQEKEEETHEPDDDRP